jgi:hypothetical protein
MGFEQNSGGGAARNCGGRKQECDAVERVADDDQCAMPVDGGRALF